MKHYWWMIDYDGRILKNGTEENDNLIQTIMWMTPGIWRRLEIEQMFYVANEDGTRFFVYAPFESSEPLPMRVKAAFDAAIDDYETQKSGRA